MDLDQENIIKMLGIQSLPDERKLAILEKLSNLIQKRLMARMLTTLPETDQKEFAETLEANNPDAMQKFINTHFPDFQSWLVEEVNLVKKEVGSFIGQI